LVFADLLASVDGLTAHKATIAHRISELASDEQWRATVARLRAFRGIDTLTARPAQCSPPAAGRIRVALQP
jgi:hypothetical protein